MKDLTIRPPLRTLALAVALLLIGFAIGRAQTPTPDFELVVSAPSGVEGAEVLVGWRSGSNEAATEGPHVPPTYPRRCV